MANLTLIISFSEILKFSKIISFKLENIVKVIANISKNSFVEMRISKLINYSMDMCWNGQGIMVIMQAYTNAKKKSFLGVNYD